MNAQPQSPPHLRLLRNVDLYAPEAHGVVHVLTAGEKIAWIGPTAPVMPASIQVEEEDVAGARVIPGLIDPHVHITGGGGEGGPQTSIPPLTLTDFTSAGITTVIGLLGTDDTTRTTGSLLHRARALTAEGITAYCLTGGYHIPPATLTGSVRSDIVFIEQMIGVGEIAISDPRSSQPTLAELLRLAADSHVAGLIGGKAGIVHIHAGRGPAGLSLIRQALDQSEIPARVWNPTHINRTQSLLEEAFDLAQRGCTIDVTAYPLGMRTDAIPALQAVAAYLDRGLPPDRITVSSDAGGSLPIFDVEGRMVRMDVGTPQATPATLQELIQSGRPVDQVVAIFTRNPAQLLRLSAKGQIAPGADADLLVLDHEGAITDVMARGTWHMRRGVMVRGGTFPN